VASSFKPRSSCPRRRSGRRVYKQQSPAGSRSPFHSCSTRNPVTIVTEISGIMFSSGLQEAQEINNIDCIFYRWPEHRGCQGMSWWLQAFCVIDRAVILRDTIKWTFCVFPLPALLSRTAVSLGGRQFGADTKLLSQTGHCAVIHWNVCGIAGGASESYVSWELVLCHTCLYLESF